MILAYFPMVSFFFSLKNDAFTGYFPPKFFMSESIKSGYLPLWNPYINFGIPQYGDMSSGFWSPFTWIIASTIGYNAYTFTIELLIYLLIGGLGIFALLKYWVADPKIRTIAAISFLCCGYNIGHLQHFNWISGAAFLPWCLWAYYALMTSFSLKKATLTALLFYLLIASAHPGISIGAMYFFIGYSLFLLIQNKKNSAHNQFAVWFKSNGTFLLLLILLSAGMLFAYADLLPYFVRAEKLSIADSLSNPATLQSWISTLLPFATTKQDLFFNTDISMRNNYFGLVTFLFLLLSLFKKKNSIQQFFLFISLFFLLLASGGLFKSFAHQYLPMIGYVRLNGEFRIFSIIGFIVIASIQLDQYFANADFDFIGIKRIVISLSLLLMFAVTYSTFQILLNQQSIFFNTRSLFLQKDLSSNIKYIIDSTSFWDTILLQGCIQLVFLFVTLKALKNRNISLLAKSTAINLIIVSLMNIPFTGVGKASVQQVQSILNRSPKGIPVPLLQPINKIDTLSYDEKSLIGDWSFYNKQIGVTHEAAYPIRLKHMANKFDQIDKGVSDSLMNQPFVYLSPLNKSNNISILSFSPNKIIIKTRVSENSTIILQESYYPHWFYTTDKIKNVASDYKGNFMKADINKNCTQVEFSFEPKWIKAMMLFSLIVFLWVIVILILPETKSTYPS